MTTSTSAPATEATSSMSSAKRTGASRQSRAVPSRTSCQVVARTAPPGAALRLGRVVTSRPASTKVAASNRNRLRPPISTASTPASPGPTIPKSEEGDTQTYGTGWVARGQSLVLRVPSAVLPVSSNYLLNPLHPQAGRLRVVRQVEVSMDPRLIRNLGDRRSLDLD